MKQILREHLILILCTSISVMLLIVFFILQINDNSALKLDGKWLAMVGVPLLVGLIAGGYITKFKGFGVELETRLKNPVTVLRLKAVDAIMFLHGDEKQSAGRLKNLSEQQIKNTKRLSFITGRINYYGIEAIAEYLRTFRNLEYIEIKKESHEFVCLIPVELFRTFSGYRDDRYFEINYAEIENFIFELEHDTTMDYYSPQSVSLTVKQNIDLLGALRVIHESPKKKVAVIDKDNRLIGLLTEIEVDHCIAEAVLETKTK
jgi:hypothetical protein